MELLCDLKDCLNKGMNLQKTIISILKLKRKINHHLFLVQNMNV